VSKKGIFGIDAGMVTGIVTGTGIIAHVYKKVNKF
jgi:hypothetical protein